jgi:hypothetical protein
MTAGIIAAAVGRDRVFVGNHVITERIAMGSARG